MALTSKEKHDIIQFLGWSGKTLIPESTHFNSIVNSRLINLNPEIERLARGLLERIKAIVAQMDEARCRMTAESVGNVKINKDEMEMLRKEYMRWIRELSDLLDIGIERTGASMMIGVTV